MKASHSIYAKTLILLTGLFFSAVSLAKNINLYDTPQNDAKVVGSIDMAKGVVPIYTPKDGLWIKVGDPGNGNVGWIKSSDIGGDGSSFYFNQRILSNDGSGPQTYQVMEVGKPKMSPQEIQSTIEKMKQQQREAQVSSQKAMETMMQEINKIYKQQQQLFSSGNYPFIMPVVVVPQSTQQPPAAVKK